MELSSFSPEDPTPSPVPLLNPFGPVTPDLTSIAPAGEACDLPGAFTSFLTPACLKPWFQIYFHFFLHLEVPLLDLLIGDPQPSHRPLSSVTCVTDAERDSMEDRPKD